jgi:hypothetical protein
MVVEPNSNILNRNGSAWGGVKANTAGYRNTSTHIWYGDLSYQLTDNEANGTTHGVKVRAIPPWYDNNNTVKNAIANGTDVTADGIYICDTFVHYDQSKSDYYGLDWTTVTGASTIYK